MTCLHVQWLGSLVHSSSTTFINDLYKLADRCNFQSVHDEMLREQMVAGLRDSRLSQHLQLDPSLTFEKAIASVRQRELVRSQQSVVI